MEAWWAAINFRERVILSVAGLIVIVIVLDSFVIESFRSRFQQLDDKIEQARDDLEWMKRAVKRLPGQNRKTMKINSGRVVTFIDQQINRQGLKKNMQQMTPIQDHSARLRLTDVEFSKLLKFFTAIDGSVIIQEVRLLPADEVGYVNVSLLITNGRAV